jgi:signal peptidase I
VYACASARVKRIAPSGATDAPAVPAYAGRDPRAVERLPPRAGVVVTLYSPLVDRRSSKGCVFEVVETLVLTLVIFFVIQTFIAQPYQVQQQSMERTLEPGQYVLVDKLTPRVDAYNRGDVVVFNPPGTWTNDDTPFIKRVIGVEGDTVEVRDDGIVYVNGTALDEDYTYKNDDGIPEPTESGADQDSWVVHAGELFVMGDHRQRSADSRVFGTIPIGNVIGRAFLRYWPISTFGVLETPTYPDLQPATS